MRGLLIFVSLYILHNLFYCTYAQDRNIGEACTESSQCTAQNSQCTGSGTETCNCQNGYFTSGNSCLKLSQCTAQNSQCTGSGTKTCNCQSGYFTSGNSCLNRNIGEACTESSQCTAQNSQCTGSGTKTCNCQSGYFTSGNSCLKRYLGQSCSTNTHCSLVTNGECSSSGICSCKSGYYQDGSGQVGRCKKRHLGESCTVDSQCSEANSVCRSNKCSCKSGYYQSGSGSTGTCTVRYLDQSCNSNSECQNTYSECRNNQCLCISGYYQTDTGRSGTCTRQALGEACTDASQCSTSSAQCSSGGNRICECRYGYYDTNGAGSGGSCSLQIQVGGICPQPTVSVLNTATCFDRNARCMSSGNSFTCQCISTYYDNQISNSRQCLPRRSLGDACNTPVNNLYQCSDSSATCTKENDVYKCKCNPGYHQEGIQCEANNALGNSCNAAIVGECSDPAANCLDSKCTCDTNSYDSNGFQNDGTCMPISYLQVTNVGFSSIQTDKITVSWTTPHNYRQYIDSFKVTWRATNANTVNTESANLDSTKTSYTLTRGIYHGRAYTVTIISINEQTQQGSQRTTFVVKYQAAKPAKTSGIDEIKSDKDVSGGTINVVWANALGYKSSFIVELKDGETVILTKTVGSIFATFSSSGLKHGYNYTITIQAKSEVYDTSKTELGEIFTTVFKTTPKRPGPPRNGVCNTPSDKSIDLFWDAPADPNGYLVRYIILVLKHGVTVFSNVSTTGTETNKTVENLVFGTTYTFRIYTVNEVGNTDSYLTVSSNCKTKAQINGGFTAWSAWTSCSLSCAGGSQTRSRTCTNPPPQYGGAQCTGQYSQSGQCNTQACQVPVNIEITLGVDVIPLRLLKDIERTKLTVTLLKGFFEESTNGDIVATGIVACVKDCNLESIKTAADFNKMSSWKQYGEQGSGFYRVTSPLWLDEIPTFCNNGRRKRSTKTIEYTVGSEYCMYVPTGEYCNGPLQPGTSYKLVAVVCNSGGCLLSRQYGPFTTVAAAQVTEECNCSTQSVVIGVVLGLIILILLVYAGYITVTIRRIRVKGGRDIMQGNKKRQISQTYVNETFGKGLSGVASGCTETEYSTLDDRSREDNTTYDILRPGLEK